LDAVIEDEQFAREMEEMYEDDLTNATEIVLDERNKVQAPGQPPHRSPMITSGGGSSSRAMAGALRIGNAVGAAFAGKRVLEPVEARLMLTIGALLFLLAIIFLIFPSVLIYPTVFLCVWFAAALLYRGVKLYLSKTPNQATELSPAVPEQKEPKAIDRVGD
jgi:cardiolipin synthase